MSTKRPRVVLTIRHPVGGIRTYVRYIYEQSFFDDFRFTLIVADDALQDYFGRIFSGRDFEYIACDSTRDMATALWRYRRQHDVALVHSHGFTAGAVSVLALAGCSTPHLMTAHDVFLSRQFAGFRGQVKQWLLSRLFAGMDAIHTVSYDASDNLLQFMPAVRSDRVCCIPHGIDSERFYQARPASLSLEYDADNTVLIGFFGRFMAQKGFRYLVDAIDIIQREKLSTRQPLVLTFDWGGFVREEYAAIEQRGLAACFHMMQYTEDMPAMIKAMDMVVMPSLWESSGLLGMEALVAGVPIVAASCIGLREVLADSPAVMVPPADARALAQAIAAQMNAPDTMVFRDYADTARQRYALQRPARALRELYDRLLQERGRR